MLLVATIQSGLMRGACRAERQELVIEKMPKLAAHLAALHCDITIVATDWFLCLFCTSVPSEVSPAPHYRARNSHRVHRCSRKLSRAPQIWHAEPACLVGCSAAGG